MTSKQDKDYDLVAEKMVNLFKLIFEDKALRNLVIGNFMNAIKKSPAPQLMKLNPGAEKAIANKILEDSFDISILPVETREKLQKYILFFINASDFF